RPLERAAGAPFVHDAPGDEPGHRGPRRAWARPAFAGQQQSTSPTDRAHRRRAAGRLEMYRVRRGVRADLARRPRPRGARAPQRTAPERGRVESPATRANAGPSASRLLTRTRGRHRRAMVERMPRPREYQVT